MPQIEKLRPNHQFILMVFQVSLVGTDLVIVNVSQSDAGTYTCELDTDDITPLAVSHVLQILGKINTPKETCQNFTCCLGLSLKIFLRHPILYSLRDTNATNISIVYCRGNRDAVLIKTIHAWLLISGHLYKCNPANNYHLDGLYVLVTGKGKLCLFNFLLFLFH